MVGDSDWEFLEARSINKLDKVKSFVKNDHLNFAIYYNYQGVVRRYFPDFILKMKNGDNLVIEVKGKDDEQNRIKRDFLNEWCKAVN